MCEEQEKTDEGDQAKSEATQAGREKTWPEQIEGESVRVRHASIFNLLVRGKKELTRKFGMSRVLPLVSVTRVTESAHCLEVCHVDVACRQLIACCVC